MESIILIVHVLLALAVIGLVLLQQGKGADMGASFGSGSSQTLFGSQGSGNFLTRTTAILATAFFITSFALAIYAKQQVDAQSKLGIPQITSEEQAPLVTEELPEVFEENLPEFDAGVVAPEAPVDSDIPQVDE